jgi:hypothetical protein
MIFADPRALLLVTANGVCTLVKNLTLHKDPGERTERRGISYPAYEEF